MCGTVYNAGFRALKVVQSKSITKVACIPWGVSPCCLLPLWEQSRASRADGHTSSSCPAGLCISTFLSLFPALFMHAVSESAAVNAKAGRVDDFFKDILNYVHAKKSLCVGWLNKRHSL